MKTKKKPKLHFEQVPLKEVERLVDKKTASSAAGVAAYERPAAKTEPYSIPLAADRKKSR